MATPGTTPARPKLPKAGFWWALGIFIVTAIVGVVMIVLSITTIANTINDFREVDVPDTTALQLDGGEYWVFAGSRGSSYDAALVDVTVTGSGGSTVRVTPDYGKYETTNNGMHYTSLGKFEVDRAGTYQIETDGPAGTTVRIGKVPVGRIVGLLVGGIAIGSLGFLLALILLIVTLVRRSSAKKRLAAAYPGAYGTPPPYVPPAQSAAPPPVMPPPSPPAPAMPPPQATPPSAPPPPAAPSTPPPPPPEAPGSSGAAPPPPAPGGGAPTPPPSGPATPPPPPGQAGPGPDAGS